LRISSSCDLSDGERYHGHIIYATSPVSQENAETFLLSHFLCALE
jgi:hypothetical protein